MDFDGLMTLGIAKAGNATELGKVIDLTQQQLSNIRAGRKPLPDPSAAKLAIYLDIRLGEVMAAAKFFYAKTEEEKAIWRPFVLHAKAASVALAASSVILFLTPSPAEAAQSLKGSSPTMYIM